MTAQAPRYADLLRRLEQARSSGVALGLERTRAVLRGLGDPQLKMVTVHIAGTNGKGSTAAMTESILRAAGLRTGLYTSPHLSRFTERIKVDGQEVEGDRLAALLPRIDATGVPLTYFELATVLGFLVFAELGVEVMVAETGLGGRLDATTTCQPVATAITSIAMDHAELLGNTLAEIAREKAGIAKPGVPLFLGPLAAEADAAIERVAQNIGAPLLRLSPDFKLPPGCPVALGGAHQRSNAALALGLAKVAAGAAGRSLSDEQFCQGLRDVVWPGRLEMLQEILLDCAHNLEAAIALAAALDTMLQRRPRALLFSVVAGKPAEEMLKVLAPRFDAIFLTQSSNTRSLTAEQLLALFPSLATPVALATPVSIVRAVDDPLQALTMARAYLAEQHQSKAVPLVVGAGSTFLVGDLRAFLLCESRDPLPTSDPVSVPIFNGLLKKGKDRDSR